MKFENYIKEAPDQRKPIKTGVATLIKVGKYPIKYEWQDKKTVYFYIWHTDYIGYYNKIKGVIGSVDKKWDPILKKATLDVQTRYKVKIKGTGKIERITDAEDVDIEISSSEKKK